MRVRTPQISWHETEPIYSIDCCGDRIATSSKEDIRLWRINEEQWKSCSCPTFLCSLKRHQCSVNVVKFSPCGKYLASGGDDGTIFIWTYSHEKETKTYNLLSQSDDEELKPSENWVVIQSWREHKDIYDLVWSPDSNFLLSASTDNSSIIWSLKQGSKVDQIFEHKHFVQGVAWDPLGKYVVTQSSDRSAKVYTISEAFVARFLSATQTTPLKKKDKTIVKVKHTLKKREIENKDKPAGPDTQTQTNSSHFMFADDSIGSFFRRCCFSPCGNIVFFPAGIYQDPAVAEPLNCIYLFARNALSKPAAAFSLPGKGAVCIRCNPIQFKNKNVSNPIFRMGYRIVFAVATMDAKVIVFDTEQPFPLALIEGIHYAPATDLAWTPNGEELIVSSIDGYCTIITFQPGELGEVHSTTTQQ